MTSSPTPGHQPWGQESWNESRPSRVPMVQIWMLSDEWLSRYELLKNLHIKLSQCDGNADADADADDRGDCNSSPCASYRRTKKTATCKVQIGLIQNIYIQELIVLAICMSSSVAWYLHEDILNVFFFFSSKAYRADTILRQTDRRPVQISLGIRPVWSVFAVHVKKPWVLSYPLSAQRRLWSDWVDAQAVLSLRWAHTHFVGFCHVAAHISPDPETGP